MDRRFTRRRLLRRGALVGVAGVAGCVGGHAEEENIVVDPDGSNARSGTEDAPLATIQEALDRAQPGDTVHVRSGQYFESPETVRSGTTTDPITITGPADAEISGRLDGYGSGLNVRHSHIHLRGLTIDGLQDPSALDDPESYVDMAINVLPASPEYLSDLVLKPHAIGNVLTAMIKVNFAEHVEIGEFTVIGPAGLGYHLTDEDGFFGEIVYVGSHEGSEFGDLDRVGELEGDDTSNDIHVHHIDNSEGHHNAEFVDTKLGVHDVTIEYCTTAGGGQVAGYGRTISVQGYDVTIRWCDLRGGRGHGVDVGIDEAIRRREERDVEELTEATRRAATGNEIYGNRVTGFDDRAFYFPHADAGQGPDDQTVFCGNEYDGETDGVPDSPCPDSVPTGDGIGHLGGDSPWA